MFYALACDIIYAVTDVSFVICPREGEVFWSVTVEAKGDVGQYRVGFGEPVNLRMNV